MKRINGGQTTKPSVSALHTALTHFSSLQTWASDPVLLPIDLAAAAYPWEFPLHLMNKDMDLVMATAAAARIRLPAATAAQAVLASNLASSGDLDLSAITPSVIGK